MRLSHEITPSKDKACHGHVKRKGSFSPLLDEAAHYAHQNIGKQH